MSILRYKNSNGQWTELPLLEGPPGMSAYEHAVAGGYDGTLEEFEELLNAVVNIDEAEEIAIDSEPIEDSDNLVTSGGVYNALFSRIASDEDIMELLYELDLINPITTYDGSILTFSDDEICSL